MLRNLILIPAICLFCTGCSFMFPYEKEFACKRGTNMGKCISSMQAYHEATSGEQHHEYAQPASKQKKKSKKKDDVISAELSPTSGYDQYKEAEYKQLTQILDKPITPILKKPEVLEILVLPYRTNNGTQLNGSRYIHIITEDSTFILGDVMKDKVNKVEGLFGR